MNNGKAHKIVPLEEFNRMKRCYDADSTKEICYELDGNDFIHDQGVFEERRKRLIEDYENDFKKMKDKNILLV
jgi:hypothetical protein